jgi:hypothetical protein
MANDVRKQAIVLAAADPHPNSLTAFQNDSGPVICNFHLLSLATDPSPGYLCSRKARTPRPGMFAPTCLRALMTDRPGAGMITM